MTKFYFISIPLRCHSTPYHIGRGKSKRLFCIIKFFVNLHLQQPCHHSNNQLIITRYAMSDSYNFSESERAFVAKAEQYCASYEQCRSSVKDKLAQWGADKELAGRIVDYLVENEYIDERRYCRLFCESKLHLQKWGRNKIQYQLRMKQIDQETIDEALDNLDPVQYSETLSQLVHSKSRSIKESDPRKRQAKLMSFLASHGFTLGEIHEALRSSGSDQ